MMDPWAVCVFLIAGIAAGVVAYEAIVRSAGAGPRPTEREGRPGGARPSKTRPSKRAAQSAQGALDALGAALARYAPLAPADADSCRERLRQAGASMSPETWRGARLVAAAASALGLGALFSLVAALPAPICLAAASAGALAGWMLPLAELARKRRKRMAAIEAGLPDAMELLGIAIAAGSPVEHCFREVAACLDGPLADEFAIVDGEVNLLGHSREEALERLAGRCRSREVGAFAAQMTQAVNQGSSISEGLAIQAALARDEAQADALERIRTMPTKLDIVLSLCFLPPTVLLLMAPTVIRLLSFLNESMG